MDSIWHLVALIYELLVTRDLSSVWTLSELCGNGPGAGLVVGWFFLTLFDLGVSLNRDLGPGTLGCVCSVLQV